MGQLIVVPGLGGVGDGHWQARWVRERAGAVMVRQRDWERPERDEWVAALDAAIREAAGPVVVVAHSLGCHTLAHWAAGHTTAEHTAAEHTAAVRAALLVAPPDIEHSAARGAPIGGFGPPAAGPLPFPAVLAASRTDPWSGIDASRRLAQRWGARFVDLGDAGHVNTDSGHGPWPEGDELLGELVRAT